MRAPLPVLGNRSQHRVLLLLLASVYPFVKVLADLGDSGHRTLAEAGIQSQGSVARETEAGCVAMFALGIRGHLTQSPNRGGGLLSISQMKKWRLRDQVLSQVA